MNDDVRKAVDRFVDLLEQDGKYEIDSVIVFGSQARGTERPDSDTDVAVLLRGERRRFLPTALAMSDIAYDVLLETDVDISPLPVWLDEWENPDSSSNPALLRNVARDGIRLRAA